MKGNMPVNEPVLCVSSGDLTEDITVIILEGNRMRVLTPSDGIYSNSGGTLSSSPSFRDCCRVCLPPLCVFFSVTLLLYVL